MTAPAATPIFITGRFRSGTTLLWNIFHRAGGCRAFYEPCHDNLIAHIRYTRPMESHRGVEDYWEAYRPLMPELLERHRTSFGITHLMMERDEKFDALEEYLRYLIDDAASDRAVLQFNRVDFRLPWLRERFPDAEIIHIHRDARESYASLTRHLGTESIDDPGRGNVYDLLEWSLALSGMFPFLIGDADTRLYDRHYYLWKLSLLMGTRCADASLSFDECFAKHPARGVDALIEGGWLPENARSSAMGIVKSVETGRWSLLHDESWYERIERKCEQTLDRLGLNESFGLIPLREIRTNHASEWDRLLHTDHQRIVDQMLIACSRQRAEVTRLLFEMRSLQAAAAEAPKPQTAER